jgi:hypothetical protein
MVGKAIIGFTVMVISAFSYLWGRRFLRKRNMRSARTPISLLHLAPTVQAAKAITQEEEKDIPYVLGSREEVLADNYLSQFDNRKLRAKKKDKKSYLKDSKINQSSHAPPYLNHPHSSQKQDNTKKWQKANLKNKKQQPIQKNTSFVTPAFPRKDSSKKMPSPSTRYFSHDDSCLKQKKQSSPNGQWLKPSLKLTYSLFSNRKNTPFIHSKSPIKAIAHHHSHDSGKKSTVVNISKVSAQSDFIDSLIFCRLFTTHHKQSITFTKPLPKKTYHKTQKIIDKVNRQITIPRY